MALGAAGFGLQRPLLFAVLTLGMLVACMGAVDYYKVGGMHGTVGRCAGEAAAVSSLVPGPFGNGFAYQLCAPALHWREPSPRRVLG
jgi:hypothetical protein